MVKGCICWALGCVPCPCQSTCPTSIGVAVAVLLGVEVVVGVLVGVPVRSMQLFSRTDTQLEFWFAAAKSRRPSPLKSPTAAETGFVATAKLTEGWNVPLPLPNRVDTLFEARLVTARSKRPSP